MSRIRTILHGVAEVLSLVPDTPKTSPDPLTHQRQQTQALLQQRQRGGGGIRSDGAAPAAQGPTQQRRGTPALRPGQRLASNLFKGSLVFLTLPMAT